MSEIQARYKREDGHVILRVATIITRDPYTARDVQAVVTCVQGSVADCQISQEEEDGGEAEDRSPHECPNQTLQKHLLVVVTWTSGAVTWEAVRSRGKE